MNLVELQQYTISEEKLEITFNYKAFFNGLIIILIARTQGLVESDEAITSVTVAVKNGDRDDGVSLKDCEIP